MRRASFTCSDVTCLSDFNFLPQFSREYRFSSSFSPWSCHDLFVLRLAPQGSVKPTCTSWFSLPAASFHFFLPFPDPSWSWFCRSLEPNPHVSRWLPSSSTGTFTKGCNKSLFCATSRSWVFCIPAWQESFRSWYYSLETTIIFWDLLLTNSSTIMGSELRTPLPIYDCIRTFTCASKQELELCKTWTCGSSLFWSPIPLPLSFGASITDIVSRLRVLTLTEALLFVGALGCNLPTEYARIQSPY